MTSKWDGVGKVAIYPYAQITQIANLCPQKWTCDKSLIIRRFNPDEQIAQSHRRSPSSAQRHILQ